MVFLCRLHECEQLPGRCEILVTVVLQLDATSTANVASSSLWGSEFSHPNENPAKQHSSRELLCSYGHCEGMSVSVTLRWDQIIGRNNIVCYKFFCFFFKKISFLLNKTVRWVSQLGATYDQLWSKRGRIQMAELVVHYGENWERNMKLYFLLVFKKTTISTLKIPVHLPTCALHNRKTFSCDCRFYCDLFREIFSS